MKILVTNDDGINAIGLQTLVKHLSTIADVYICAPDSERSAFSHHFTVGGKIKYEVREVPFAKKAIALWGTPCDCMFCGLQALFKDENIDLVVSGINRGWNVASDAIYSGTIAGAREAFMQGVPSMAVSLDTFDPYDYNCAASIATKFALMHFNNKDNKKYFLNINVPALPENEIKGYKICDVEGKVEYQEKYQPVDNGIETFLEMGKANKIIHTPEGSDTKALQEGYVSVSPLYNQHINHQAENLEEIYLKNAY